MHRIHLSAALPLLLGALLLVSATPVGAAHSKGAALLRTAPNATLGRILVAPSGKTLYQFSADRNGSIGCKGACLQFWFPLRVPKGARVPAKLPGVSGKLGQINRGRGVRQVTFRGHPLYTYVGDQRAGQISGQGLDTFGGVWSVATVRTSSSSGSSSSGSSGGNGYGGYGMGQP
jgi:predicted lipoprotein with Yx(FWY)xxD motif